MAMWTAFPCDDTSHARDAAGLKKQWVRLHIGDAEPLPKDAAVLTAWGHFHAGEFEKAHDAGLKAYALGRDGQGISVAKALAQGLGSQVKNALETTIQLAPKHADAHIALGAFHAEVIDKVGKLLGRTQGADAATGLNMFQQALKLNAGSAIGMVGYANGLVMLEGNKRMKEAEKLYAQAAACEAADAMERLDIEMAKAELED
ncbi:MAG: hypothetical protein QE285_09850 [Aquabacterium sp.]|nr:hypothetical protein [Aquabacterium sp.]